MRMCHGGDLDPIGKGRSGDTEAQRPQKKAALTDRILIVGTELHSLALGIFAAWTMMREREREESNHCTVQVV